MGWIGNKDRYENQEPLGLQDYLPVTDVSSGELKTVTVESIAAKADTADSVTRAVMLERISEELLVVGRNYIISDAGSSDEEIIAKAVTTSTLSETVDKTSDPESLYTYNIDTDVLAVFQAATDIIDDDSEGTDTTWSSDKIATEISNITPQERLVHNPATAIPMNDTRGRVIGSASSPNNSTTFNVITSDPKEGASVIIFQDNVTSIPSFLDSVTSDPITYEDLTGNSYVPKGFNILVLEFIAGEFVLMNTPAVEKLNPITDATTSRAATTSDLDRVVYFTNEGAITYTFPATALIAGASVKAIPLGTGQVTVAAGVGTTLYGDPSTSAQYKPIEIYCKSTTEIIVIGGIA